MVVKEENVEKMNQPEFLGYIGVNMNDLEYYCVKQSAKKESKSIRKVADEQPRTNRPTSPEIPGSEWCSRLRASQILRRHVCVALIDQQESCVSKERNQNREAS